MVLNLLRSLLIDWALDTRNEAMFYNLLSDDWEQYVVTQSERDEPVTPYRKRLVLWDRRRGQLAVFHFPSIKEDVILSVLETDFDDRGWRDLYGFTVYDRLRSAGYKVNAMWMPIDEYEFGQLSQAYCFIHPRQLVLKHPSRTVVVNQEPHAG